MTHLDDSDEHLAAIGERLAARVRDSARRHREFRTVRRADRHWRAAGPGAAEAVLVEHPQARVTMVRLDAGAALPWSPDATRQEVLVVDGALRARPRDGADVLLDRHAFALRDAADAGTLVAHGGPAEVYRRELRVPPEALPEVEARWWSVPHAPLTAVRSTERRWRDTFPGVQIMALWGVPEITSMLVRFAPGAGVPDHRHDVHEDCLMLEGEMFLGDILLRPGDYQLAPAGGGHFGEMSDVGGLFFFHGAIDPVLIPRRG